MSKWLSIKIHLLSRDKVMVNSPVWSEYDLDTAKTKIMQHIISFIHMLFSTWSGKMTISCGGGSGKNVDYRFFCSWFI